MAKDRTEALHDAFEFELNRERAATLGRAAHRLDKQMNRCLRLLRQVDTAEVPSGSLLDAYRAACDEYERLRWTFCVQREVVGLLDHTLLYQMYPLPPRR